MSRYEWPSAPGGRGERDDPARRAAHNAARRTEFDADGALRASRTPRQPTRRPGAAPGPFAPPSGRQFLWQPLGPAVLLGGQAEGSPRVSGRINALCVHDGGQRAYAASANGGVWYTKDGGASWVSVAGLATTNAAGILRPAQRNACGALHVDFGATEGDDVVFLGTGEVSGEMTGEAPSPEGGIGILVATAPTRSAEPDPWVREAPNLVNDGVYRIAREPGGSTVVAATRTGLWQRPASPGANVSWVRPSGAPFDSLATDCTDLLWTPANGGRPARLWVWVKDGEHFGLWMRAGTSGDFARVPVADGETLAYVPGRAALAASTPATQVWVLNDRGPSATFPGLFRVANPASGAATANAVVGVPNVLRDSGWYNVAIAVDPARPDRVVVAGSYLGDPYDAADRALVTTPDGAQRWFDASIVVGDVARDAANGNRLTFGHPAPWTMLGIGVHPDVHALAYSNGGATLWTGCDGGVFRSDRPTSPAGFHACNHGLSISESNYLAAHPTCEGSLVAGLQDNGLVSRLSSGVWRVRYVGDGGGIALNALRPDQWIGQSTLGTWYVDPPTGTGPLVRGGNIVTAERDAAAFYSMPACNAHVRTPASGPAVPFSQLLVGTRRLWYSDDFGARWFTLPTATDPLPANTTQDDVGAQITVCRWQGPDVAWVLGQRTLLRYARTPGSHEGGGPGTWSAPVTPPGMPTSGKAKKRPPSVLDADAWTDVAVNLDPPPAAGRPPAQRGTLGALYLGTTGKPDRADVDTLWWFDGTDRWHPTRLRTDPRGVPAPVTAIVCDPLSPRDVWVGTTVGVWHGVRTDHGADPPTWEWTQRVNGLPEAAVEDLQLFRDGTLVLLRAAIASRGVWELRLDVPDVQELTYLRAHEDDLRHREEAVTRKRDLAADRSWHGSPDVRPRVAPVAIPVPASLPWRRSPFTGTREQLRRFQAALRASTGDPRVVADGAWDPYFSEVLRDHGAPTVAVAATPTVPAHAEVRVDAAFWSAHVTGAHATAEPWGAGRPTEADLYELTAELTEGDPGETSCARRAGPLKVDVVVHHRGMDPLDGANVRVTLLRWTDPQTPTTARWDAPGTWVSGPVTWTSAVNEVLNSADGRTTASLGAGWELVPGTPTTSRRVTLDGQTLDPLRAGIATFDLDLAGVPANTVVLLVAVVRAGPAEPAHDIELQAAELRTLALRRPSVAVRSLKVL